MFTKPPENPEGMEDPSGQALWDWFIPICTWEMIIRRNRPENPKPPSSWMTATPEALLFDIVYHMGKLTKAAFAKDWMAVIRQCANCANEFAMLAQVADAILHGPLDAELGGDRAVAAPAEVAERKPGGWGAARPEPAQAEAPEPAPQPRTAPAPSTINRWICT